MGTYFDKSYRESHIDAWNLKFTSKFTWNEVGNWCNFTAPFSNRWFFFSSYHRCWLWNQLNQRTLVILVIGLPVQLNGILKKLSWKTMVLLEFSEGTKDSCYSVPTTGNPWTHIKQGWCYKVWQPIMSWYMNLLAFSYPLRNASRCYLWPP